MMNMWIRQNQIKCKTNPRSTSLDLGLHVDFLHLPQKLMGSILCHPPSKIHRNPFTSLCVTVLTNQDFCLWQYFITMLLLTLQSTAETYPCNAITTAYILNNIRHGVHGVLRLSDISYQYRYRWCRGSEQYHLHRDRLQILSHLRWLHSRIKL